MTRKKESSAPKKLVAKIQTKEDEASTLSEFSKKKREQIMKAALETFLELGYEGTSMNLVAERAGVIKQTIYTHFNDKEGLFTCVIGAMTFDRIQPVFAPAAIEGKTPEQVLRNFATTLAAAQAEPRSSKLMRTIIGESGRFPQLAQYFSEATVKPGIQLLTNYLSNHKDIYLPDPEAFARVFLGAVVHYSMQQQILHGKKILPFEFNRVLDELMRIFALCSKKA